MEIKGILQKSLSNRWFRNGIHILLKLADSRWSANIIYRMLRMSLLYIGWRWRHFNNFIYVYRC